MLRRKVKQKGAKEGAGGVGSLDRVVRKAPPNRRSSETFRQEEKNLRGGGTGARPMVRLRCLETWEAGSQAGGKGSGTGEQGRKSWGDQKV